MIEEVNHSDLEIRLKNFALEVLKVVKKLPRTQENIIYGNQIIRSSSSMGANYSEAIYAHTKPDFLHDLNKCRKETKETVYWLELLLEVNTIHKEELVRLLDEGNQLLKIFISSIKTTKENMNKTKSSIINNKS